jgi:hypothetical protein
MNWSSNRNDFRPAIVEDAVHNTPKDPSLGILKASPQDRSLSSPASAGQPCKYPAAAPFPRRGGLSL